MGVLSTIGFARFPKQGTWLGKTTKVCFNYDTSNTILGKIVRDDNDEPGVVIIKLDDGRYILDTECQHQLMD